MLKVAGGHNCWLSSNSACADILTTWIRNWAGSRRRRRRHADPAAGAGRSSPSATEQDLSGFGRRGSSRPSGSWCAIPRAATACAATPRSATTRSRRSSPAPMSTRPMPRRAPRSTWTTPARSRLVVRLREESHNCWTSSCANDANAMQAQIDAFAAGISLTPVDPALQISRALTLVRRHGGRGRQPLRSQHHRQVRVQDRHGQHHIRHQRRRAGAGPRHVRRHHLDGWLGRQHQGGRQGAGHDRRQPQAGRPPQGHRRILHRGVGRACECHAGRRVHRQLFRWRDGAQRDPGAARLPVRGADARRAPPAPMARLRC